MESASNRRTEEAIAKVPAITVLFWIIKILTTGMGEATSDFLAQTNLLLAVTVGLGGFILAIRWQLRAPAYVARTYWFAVAMVAVFGTMAADGLHVVLGVPYAVSTSFYAVVTGVIFLLWYRSEQTLSIHSITTRRRELYYWSTVLATFALGTAAGDLTATSLKLGFFSSGLIFGAAILVPLIAWRLGFNPIAAFWIAYVITRPLGASFADWLSKPHSTNGGLGLGDGVVAAATAVVIAVLVAVTSRRQAAAGASNSRNRGSDKSPVR
jgi:uncharacterized membrane-anchored protein